MDYTKIKRKIIKAGVELRVELEKGNGYNHVHYFANKLEAEVFAKRHHAGKNFRITSVRLDATPLLVPGVNAPLKGEKIG